MQPAPPPDLPGTPVPPAPSPTWQQRLRAATFRDIVFVLAVVLCLTPWVSPPIALAMGFAVAWTIGHPFLHLNRAATKWLLQASVVGLGFGMNAHAALAAGREGVLFTVVSIIGTLVLAFVLGRALGVERKTSHLIACGTAICGGSAIAAVAPVIKAEEKQISVALGTVFILNSVALFVFPVVGHALHLTPDQFGLWCAIAIHDTSSVVGAASKFGDHALGVATTVKLARALWIIPLAIGSAFVFKQKASSVSIPWFIGWFVLALLANSYIPAVQVVGPVIVRIAKVGLTLTLFLIGAGLSRKVLRSVGPRPLVQAVVLWLAIAGGALAAVIGLV